MKDYSLDYRHYVIGGVALLIVVIYIIRLFMLQITSDDYKKSADSNAFLKKIEYPLVEVSTTVMESCWYITSQPMILWW